MTKKKKILIGVGIGTLITGAAIGVAVPLVLKQNTTEAKVSETTKPAKVRKYGKGNYRWIGEKLIEITGGYITKQEFFEFVEKFYEQAKNNNWRHHLSISCFEAIPGESQKRVIGWHGSLGDIRTTKPMTLEEYKEFWVKLIKNNGQGLGTIHLDEGQHLTDWIDLEE